MKLVLTIILTAFSIPCLAQSPGKAEIFSSAMIHGQLAQLAQQAKASGSSGSTLGNYGTHALKL